MVPVVAVVGIGRRYPKGLDVGPPRRRSLSRRRAESTPDPPERSALDRPHRVRGIGGTDPAAFGISQGEADRLAPEDWLLLELSREAVEDAGLAARPGAPGVVVIGDWRAARARRRGADISGLLDPAGRISRALGWTGPCLTVDTSTSSSLAAIHVARELLRCREIPFALAGGVGLVRSRSLVQSFSTAGLLSRQGRCRFGDALTDGTSLAEAGAVVVLKRLEDALRDADFIAAVILGSSLRHQGTMGSEGLTPDIDAQVTLLRAAMADAGVGPADYGYVECHGSGTPRGDLAELEALSRIFGSRAARQEAVPVGSIKSRVGHTGAACGVTGLLHAANAVTQGEVPCTCRGVDPRPDASWLGIGLAREAVPIRPGSVVGVTSLGMSGTNVHVILRREEPSACLLPDRPAQRVELLVLSAETAEGLHLLARRFSRYLNSREASAISLGDLCAAAAMRRSPQQYRLAVWGDSLGALRHALRRRIRDGAIRPRDADLVTAPGELFDLIERFEAGEVVDFSVLYPPPVRWVALPSSTWRRRPAGLLREAAIRPPGLIHQSTTRSGFVSPDGLVELVKQLVTDELGLSSCSDRPDASLVEQGLDSLSAMRLADSIRQRLGLVVKSIFLLDRETTTAALTAWLREEEALEMLSINEPDGTVHPQTEEIVP